MENVEIRKIGAEQALQLLENNSSNRKISRANVDFIKNEMDNKNFLLNGSTIVLSENGTLLDGQHRLIAISETKHEYDLIFVVGAKDNVFQTIDTGKSRNSSDILSIEGVKNAKNVASTIRKTIEEFGSKRSRNGKTWVKLSNTEVLEHYNKHKEELEETIELCGHLYNKYIKVIPVSTAAAFMILFSRQDKIKAKSFIRELYNGNKEGASNASLTLRQRLINGKIEGTRISDDLLRALFVVAFRAYNEDRDLSRIKISKNLNEYLFLDK